MIKGFGLHSGANSEVRFFLEEGPVRFLRNGKSIAAWVPNVSKTERCTLLSDNGEQLALVEHVLAALHITGWWKNLVIEVTGPELPILDGSALGWLEAIEALGEAPESPETLQLQEPFKLELNSSSISTLPNPVGNLELTVGIEFDHPAIGKQQWSGSPESYSELLSARTFGFLAELEYLKKQGLASRAGLENAIVFSESGALQELRFHNEPVRHKALDALGDLFLIGRPLSAKLDIMRGSHALHVAFARQVWQENLQRPDGFIS